MRDPEMAEPIPKELTLLAASIVTTGLFLVEPARALTSIAQPYFASSRESAMAVQPIKQRRCYGYRDGRRIYHPCPPRLPKAKRMSSWYGTSRNSSYYKPWSGIQLCENCPAIK
jgi:hypothetical protein